MNENNPLKVKNRTIYNKEGQKIDNISFIFDKTSGLLKYGDSEKWVEQHYIEMLSKYRQAGLNDIAEDIILVKFDRYNNELSIEEICAFLNYIILVSSNSEKIMKMLDMNIQDFKLEIKKLQELGY